MGRDNAEDFIVTEEESKDGLVVLSAAVTFPLHVYALFTVTDLGTYCTYYYKNISLGNRQSEFYTI